MSRPAGRRGGLAGGVGWLALLRLAALGPGALLRLAAFGPSAPRGAGAVEAAQGVPLLTLRDGRRLPALGFGCSNNIRKEHVLTALRLGYRHFDTAQAYDWAYYEEDVGDAVAESGVPRDSLHLQTKIHPKDLGYEPTLRAFKDSLRRLRTDYVDSLLIHKPWCFPGACPPGTPLGTWPESWKALEELYDSGAVRAIGISDADDQILDALAMQRIPAHLVQNRMDPFHQDAHVRARCRELGIQYQAYSSLGTTYVYFLGWRDLGNPVMADPTLRRIAAESGCTVAQVVLQWSLLEGVAVIPSAKRPENQRANIGAASCRLTPRQVEEIRRLDGLLAEGPLVVNVTLESDAAGFVDVASYDPEDGTETWLGIIAAGLPLTHRAAHGSRLRFYGDRRTAGSSTSTWWTAPGGTSSGTTSRGASRRCGRRDPHRP